MHRFVVLSMVLAACGGGDGGGGHLADAPPSIDGATAPLPVTLTISHNATRVSGVRVYFLNADDTVAATANTDSDGTASATVGAGGSVTAIDPFPSSAPALAAGPHDLRTFAGVAPGDQLELTADDPLVSEFTLFAPFEDRASDYQLYTTCGAGSIDIGNSSGSASSIQLSNCGGTRDVAIVAMDQGAGVSGLVHPSLDLSGGGTFDLTSDTYSNLVNRSFTYTNAPDAPMQVWHAPLLGHGPLGPFVADVIAGAAAISEPSVSAAASLTDTIVFQAGQHDVVDWGPTAADYALQLDTTLLGDITVRPTYDPASHKLAWTEADATATPDFTAFVVDATRSSQDAFLSWQWRISAPYTRGEYRLPVLPTDLADWTPRSDDVQRVSMMNAKVPGGYDAVRPHVLVLWDQALLASPRSLQFSGFATGASGRVVTVQSLGPVATVAARRN